MKPALETRPDPVGAFMPDQRSWPSGSQAGPLGGLGLAVKDLFDIAGTTTGFGNPDWARTHLPAAVTAAVIQALLDAGAHLVGKTKTVELAYGLTGENPWYGTPINPRAPDRFPGGSSCGSAAAVAARLVELALGSDTGGSVRIPASYCGLFGIRPTHGAISLVGACPLAPSMDTPGWFTRDASLLERIGDVLLPADAPGPAVPGPLLRFDEAWDNADPAVAEAVAPGLAALVRLLGPALRVRALPDGPAMPYRSYRAVLQQEAWASLGGWIEAERPTLSVSGQQRFAAAKALDPNEAAGARATRRSIAARMHGLLGGGAVLAFPTSPVVAPLLAATAEEQEVVRERTHRITAIASLCGLPEVSVPVTALVNLAGPPVGLSIVAAPGRDRMLISLAGALAATLSV